MKDIFVLNKKTNTNLDWAVNFCNDVLFNSDEMFQEFLSAIEEKKSFDMATANADYIVKKIIFFKNGSHQMNVKLYRSRNPWSKAYGYYTPSRPFDININTRKMNRSVESFIGTLVHEMIHAIDGLDMIHNFGHGDNSSAGKQDTAPYFIGNLAAEFWDGRDISGEEYPRIVRTTIWQRIWRWLF